MLDNTSQEIRSIVTSEGCIEISIARVEKPKPLENEVLIKVEASSGAGLLDMQGSISASLDVNVLGTGSFNGGIVLTAPNGTQYRVTVDNSGNLTTSPA